MRTLHNNKRGRQPSRQAFTLIELLVVIGLILTLVTLTVVSVDFAFDDERVSGVSRQLQAYIEGSRDRALRAREIRGVRLMVSGDPVDDTDPSGRVATAAFYIKQLRWESTNEDPADSVLLIRYGNGFNQSIVLHNDGLMWQVLKLKKAMPTPESTSDYNMRIRFGEDHRWTGARWVSDSEWNAFKNWLENLRDEYRSSIPPAVFKNPDQFRAQALRLATASPVIEKPSLPSQPRVARQFSEYQLDLPPTIVPNEKPLIFPDGVVIDLDASKVPASWRPATGSTTQARYSNRMDILFDPTGSMTGENTIEGWIHLCLAQRTEVLELTQDNGSGTQYRVPVNTEAAVPLVPSDSLRETLEDQAGERKAVSISPGSGRILTSIPDSTDSPIDANFAGSPYEFSEGGR